MLVYLHILGISDTQVVRHIDRRVIGVKKTVFKFEDLHPMSAYMMCIEVDNNEGMYMFTDVCMCIHVRM